MGASIAQEQGRKGRRKAGSSRSKELPQKCGTRKQRSAERGEGQEAPGETAAGRGGAGEGRVSREAPNSNGAPNPK